MRLLPVALTAAILTIILAWILAANAGTRKYDPATISSNLITKEVEVGGRAYLAQWCSTGHSNEWRIVAGPIK